ncbi:MAG: hypothetical protein FD177_2244 [Desulfovibrionaceae bacterium]|nr:MAG: hypothetical protein FD177_2244 [Desulfovibrionaceae bacterium]
MVNILREADREPVAEVAKKNDIGGADYLHFAERFSGLSADEVKRLRQM